MIREPGILFVGTVPPPFHGQAIAFQAAFESMHGRKYLVNQNFETKSVWMKSLLMILSFFKIWYFLLFKKIDAVYFTCSRSLLGSLKDVVLVFSAKCFRLPVVNHLHGAGMREFIERLPRFYRAIVFRMYSRIDISIILLESMRREFQQFWPDMDVRVVPNFYTKSFEGVKQKPARDTIKIVYLSNIIYSKGILDLLDAFAELSSHYAQVELVIAGDYMDDTFYSRKQIEQMFMRRLEKLERVRYVGVVSGEEKVELLAQSDIFVLPTFYPMEAFPLSIIEAMRAGDVIVATQHNYLPEIVKAEMGALVEPRSPDLLVSALKRIVDDPQKMRRIQNHNMEYAKAHYAVSGYIQKLDAILKDVVRQ